MKVLMIIAGTALFVGGFVVPLIWTRQSWFPKEDRPLLGGGISGIGIILFLHGINILHSSF